MDNSRKNNRRPRRRLNDGDVARIVRALAGAGSTTRSLVVLALATGARLHEIQQLRWNDIDICSGTIRFRGGKGSYAVPLLPDLAVTLAAHRVWQQRTMDRAYVMLQNPHVLSGPTGGPLSLATIGWLFSRHTEAACGRRIPVHAARLWVRQVRGGHRGL